MKYEVPFTYPEDLGFLELSKMLIANNLTMHPSKHQIDNGLPRNIGEYLVTGTQENLISFFREVDGPGQSFPVTEFITFIQDYKVEA